MVGFSTKGFRTQNVTKTFQNELREIGEKTYWNMVIIVEKVVKY